MGANLRDVPIASRRLVAVVVGAVGAVVVAVEPIVGTWRHVWI